MSPLAGFDRPEEGEEEKKKFHQIKRQKIAFVFLWFLLSA